MAEVCNLTRAPITEAVIDFRCVTGAKIDSELSKKLKERTGYAGKAEELKELSFFAVSPAPGLSVAPQPALSPPRGLRGYRFFAEDGKFVVQMRSNGMSVSRLQPYTNWNDFFSEATRLWDIYNRDAQVKEVSRIAVRNINRLIFPKDDFSNNPSLFLAPPPPEPVGAAGGSTIVQWMTRFVINEAAENINATVTQLSDSKKPESDDSYAIIFDIDVFTKKDLSKERESLLPRFTQLRELKNRIFFSGLTDHALSFFK